ncbi:uncharacterized protein [Musca autumnalis]|uniref:uncharacterized protein n=1 Tax=Musca autumnalis TaxID=221902 RepID=UPI003CFB4CA3
MKLLSLALLFALLIAGSYSSDPEHPGKCVYEDLILSPGEDGQPKGKCERIMCGEDLVGEVVSCDQILMEPVPPCWWGEEANPGVEFPACCGKKLICPEQSNFGVYQMMY